MTGIEVDLAILKRDVAQLGDISERLTIAVEEIRSTNANVEKMLAVHEERQKSAVAAEKEIRETVDRHRHSTQLEIQDLKLELTESIQSSEHRIIEKLEVMVDNIETNKNNIAHNRSRLGKLEKLRYAVWFAGTAVVFIIAYFVFPLIIAQMSS